MHGGAKGADNIAGFVAHDILGLRVRSYPVDEKIDGPWPAAGPNRNFRMLAAENPYELDGSYVDLGLAFKLTEKLTHATSPGTFHMATQMSLGGIDVVEIHYDRRVWSNTLKLLGEKIEVLCSRDLSPKSS